MSSRRRDRDAGDGALDVTRVSSIVAPLFVPADRPDRFAKAAASGADAVILDLEDAVSPDAKDVARCALTADFTDLPVVVRVNAPGTPWHHADLAAAARLPIAAIMVPKVESAAELVQLSPAGPLIALIETARGIDAVRSIARSGRAIRLAFGSVDYAADLGCEHMPEALAAARAEIVLASRLAGLAAPLEGVTVELAEELTAANARRARALGFGGKMAIHPRQIRWIVAAFTPAAAEIEWAQRVLASGEGATMVDGAMVDAPVRSRARAILERANATRASARG